MERQRHLLKSKIHRARVTDANVDYEGSISIDRSLMESADILPYERVQLLSVETGARLETYAIPAEGSGEMCINGAAARVIGKGEVIIVLTYTWVDDTEARGWTPKVVYVDESNRALARTSSPA
ncbi:MAG: aspartate 1-decarboxylase [Candidatus Aquicultorales bacterium]